MNLTDHLAACVRETNRVTGSIDARRTLAEAAKADPELRAAAEAKLAALPDAITAKCFIARTERAALEEILR